MILSIEIVLLTLFYFQPFRFYQQCIYIFTNRTEDQFIEWKSTIRFTKREPDFIIALPGIVQTINIKFLSGMNTSFALFNWLQPPAIQTRPIKNLTLPMFKDFASYRKHTYARQTALGTFYFVKYVFKDGKTLDTYVEEANALIHKFGQDHQMTEKDFNCTG